jgi:glycosyltransferase involved in cell wall biosynthesis
MRILQAAHSYYPERNGIAEVVARISEGLVARGHEVHVATGSSPRRLGPTTNINGVTVHSFPVEGEWFRGMRGPVGDYVDFVLQGNWDVVVNHAGQSWPFDALLDHVPALKAGRVYVPHGMSAINNPKWKAYFGRMPEILGQYDHVVCLSEIFDEKPFCDRHGIRHCTVISNGVDLAEFEQQQLGVRDRWGIGGKAMVLNVSNHNPAKCHARLHRLARRFDPDEATFVQIGNSFPAGRFNLGRLGVRGGCYYRCMLESARGRAFRSLHDRRRAEILSAYKEADVFVLTSTWEASPVVVLEAMAAGLPWIAFDVGNVREHRGGVVVQDEADLEQTLRRWLQDPSERARLGAEGRARIHERHDWRELVIRYENVFLEAARRRSRVAS